MLSFNLLLLMELNLTWEPKNKLFFSFNLIEHPFNLYVFQVNKTQEHTYPTCQMGMLEDSLSITINYNGLTVHGI